MAVHDILTAIQNSPIAHAISKTDHMVGAGLQIIHVMGLVLFLASLVLISLRLLRWVLADQPIDDVHLVEDRELDRDDRQLVEAASRHRHPVLVLHVGVDEVVAMPPVARQDQQDEKIRGEDDSLGRRHRLVNLTAVPSKRDNPAIILELPA